MNTYCLYCDQNKCESLVRDLPRALDCRAIYPRKIQHNNVHGQFVDYEHPLFPGYIFLYKDGAGLNLRTFHLKGVISVLNDPKQDAALKGGDHDFAMMLLKKNGIIGKTKVCEKNGELFLCDEAFEKIGAVIRKVDNRCHRVEVVMNFADSPVRVWVEYELVRS